MVPCMEEFVMLVSSRHIGYKNDDMVQLIVSGNKLRIPGLI